MTSKLKVQTIAHTNNTSAMSIDSSGRVTTSARPAFSVEANLSSPYQGVNLFGSTLKVNFNVGSHFATSGTHQGGFVAPVTGLYQLAFNCFSSASNGGSTTGTFQSQFTKNGDTDNEQIGIQGYGYSASNTYQQIMSVQIFQLTANDVVKVRIKGLYAYASTDYHTNPTFSGYLIG